MWTTSRGDLDMFAKIGLPFASTESGFFKSAVMLDLYIPTGEQSAGVRPRHAWYLNTKTYTHPYTADRWAFSGGFAFSFDFNKLGAPLTWNLAVSYVAPASASLTQTLVYSTGVNWYATSWMTPYLEFSAEMRMQDKGRYDMDPMVDPMLITPGFRFHLPYNIEFGIGLEVATRVFTQGFDHKYDIKRGKDHTIYYQGEHGVNASYGYAESGTTGYAANSDGSINYNEPINTAAAAARRGEVNTCPIAYDADGNMLTDAKGIPLPMYYCYNESYRYQFQGGDAIYEDVNHDGQIDRYDMVYLGNSNPKCNGGFGFQLFYEKFSLNTGFNFRMGNKIVNLARMNYESMLNNNNQSFATTWRWRKNGDETVVPRALSHVNGYNSYNSLPSDRYVEDGNYLRLQYVQLSYDFDAKKLKKYGIRNLKLFASLNNLWVWTKYTGVDPDVSPQGFAVCTDNSRTPRTKSFTCSINLGF